MSSNKVPDNKHEAGKSASNRSRLLILTAILLAGFALSFVAASQLSKKDKPADSHPHANAPASEVKDGKTIHHVSLAKDSDQPVDLLIKTGEYVQFNSKDGGEHQIIQGASTNTEHAPTDHVPSPLDSGLIKSDEGYLLQFKQIGKFDFHDNYNHHYTITVIVYDPGKSAEDIRLTN